MNAPYRQLLAATVTCLAVGAAPAQEFDFAREGVLGTSFALRVAAPDAATAAKAEQVVLAEINRLEGILSGHRDDSEFAQFVQRRHTEQASKELLDVLGACDRWGKATRGAFDAAFRRSADEHTAVAAGYSSPWQLDLESGTARLPGAQQVGLDGLAKGYVIDHACAAAMRCKGVRGVLVDIGGDLRVTGTIERIVKVANPLQPADNAAPLFAMKIRDRAVATSGSYARPVRKPDGTGTESHIRDPKDGAAVTAVLGATVVAPDCVDADALATALHVMKVEAGIELIESMDGYECVVVDASGTVYQTSGVPALTEGAGADAAAPTVAIPAAGLEVVLSFEIRKPEGKSRRSYRRPYVAVWIEDEQGNDVCTLGLWIQRHRWLRDLRSWYRIHRRDKDLIDTISRATRRPGQYELVWRGKSNDRKELPTGNYVLCLEVAREHGTHQMMRAPFKTKADQSVTMEPNEEIARAVLTVRRRGNGQK